MAGLQRKHSPPCSGPNCCEVGCPQIAGITTIEIEHTHEFFSYSKTWDLWDNPGTAEGFATRDRSLSYWFVNGPTVASFGSPSESYEVCEYFFYPPQTLYSGVAANAAVGDSSISTLRAMLVDVRTAGDMGSLYYQIYKAFFGSSTCEERNTWTFTHRYYYVASIIEFYARITKYKRLSDGSITYSLRAYSDIDQVVRVNHSYSLETFYYPSGPTDTVNVTGRALDSSMIPIGGYSFGTNTIPRGIPCRVTLEDKGDMRGYWESMRLDPWATGTVDFLHRTASPLQTVSSTYPGLPFTIFLAQPVSCTTDNPSATDVTLCVCTGSPSSTVGSYSIPFFVYNELNPAISTGYSLTPFSCTRDEVLLQPYYAVSSLVGTVT